MGEVIRTNLLAGGDGVKAMAGCAFTVLAQSRFRVTAVKYWVSFIWFEEDVGEGSHGNLTGQGK